MPLREKKVVHGARRSIELPGIAVDVPAGKSLFLTVSPVADMYAGQNGRVPAPLILDHAALEVHRVH
jgi:ABC-2 type transport system ATP-binding protein